MLFNTRCAGCDRPGRPLCSTCRFALLGPPPTVHAPAVHAMEVVAAVRFTGRARDIVLGLKYRNRRAVARHLGGLVVNRLIAAGAHRQLDVVTWAPTSGVRRRRRGFDQAEAVARVVARQLGVPCRSLLRRPGDGAPQTGRGRLQRLAGPTFVARPGLGGRTVLVVDDVVTTGATLAAAHDALAAAGASEVRLAAVAATPRTVTRSAVRRIEPASSSGHATSDGRGAAVGPERAAGRTAA